MQKTTFAWFSCFPAVHNETCADDVKLIYNVSTVLGMTESAMPGFKPFQIRILFTIRAVYQLRTVYVLASVAVCVLNI